jgi:hypothetical protein
VSDEEHTDEESPDEAGTQPGAAKMDYAAEMNLITQEILDIFQPNRPGARERRANRREREQ